MASYHRPSERHAGPDCRQSEENWPRVRGYCHTLAARTAMDLHWPR